MVGDYGTNMAMAVQQRRKARPPLDAAKLEELALGYVGRFATSRAKLRTYLQRKLRERGWDGEAEPPIEALADKFEGSDNQRSKFIAAPWTSEDGDAFPDGQHVAFSHWSVGADGDPSGEQTGVWQYCSGVSGEALDTFMQDYPYTDSPEPNAG